MKNLIQLGEGRYLAPDCIEAIISLSQVDNHDFTGVGIGDGLVIDLCKGTPAKTAIVTVNNIVFLTNFSAAIVKARVLECNNPQA